MRTILIIVLLLAFPVLAIAQDDFSKVEIKATKVSGNVYMSSRRLRERTTNSNDSKNKV